MTEWNFPVDASHVMMFARAVGDPNPVYHDSAYAAGTEPGSIIAPPTFVAAVAQFDPGYFLRPTPGEPWLGSGRTPTGRTVPPAGNRGGTGLHAEQHYEYLRPVRAGDVLTPSTRAGREWETQGRRAGMLHFRETVTEFHDRAGELVVIARSVTVQTERPVSGD